MRALIGAARRSRIGSTNLERRLDPAAFVRLSRSLSVNVNVIGPTRQRAGGTRTVILDNATGQDESRADCAAPTSLAGVPRMTTS